MHFDPPPKGVLPLTFYSIFIVSALPYFSVHFCWARRARQKCTETHGRFYAINIK